MDIFSNLMVIGECLLDVRRTRAFQRAIEGVVKPGDVVLDVGTGSGILAMSAAQAGAKKIYAVDIARDIAQFAQQNIDNNGLTDKIQVVVGDIKKIQFKENIDVVTMEMMDTGLVAEQQGLALNSLRKRGIISPQTRLIPYRYQCAAALVEYDFSFYGFYMPFVIQARNFAVKRKILKFLSGVQIYRDIDFREHINTKVDELSEVKVVTSGTANALLLKSRSFLSPGQAIWGTTDMNMPVVVALGKQKVREGEAVKVHIRYHMGRGFSQFLAELVD